MTRLLISTAFAGLLAFSPVWGQDRDDHHDQHAQPAPAAHAAPPPRPAAQPRQTAQPRPQMGGKFDQNLNRSGAPAARNAPAARPPSQPAPRDAMRGHAPNNPGPGMAMRGQDRGQAASRNFTAYQRNFNAPRRFHAAAYHQPRGWYARRWTYGQILPALFWTPDFWLNDFGDYGLQPPPPGTVWVRDGGDAILIDRFSGEIIQVDYGVFY